MGAALVGSYGSVADGMAGLIPRRGMNFFPATASFFGPQRGFLDPFGFALGTIPVGQGRLCGLEMTLDQLHFSDRSLANGGRGM